MNINRMKFIDRYAGLPLCFLLFIHHKIKTFLSIGRKEAGLDQVKKILVIKFWGMGSIILASPAVHYLKERFPNARISILTLNSNREICSMIPEIDDIYFLEIRRGFFNFAKDVLVRVREIRKECFDITLDFEFFTKFSAIVTYLSGAPSRVGFYAFEVWRGKLHTKEVPFNRYWHVSKNFLNLAAVAIDEVIEFRDIWPSKPLIRAEDLRLIEEKIGGGRAGRIIVININAADLAIERRWPRDKYEDLVRRLSHSTDNLIAFIGGREDETYVRDVVSVVQGPDIVDFCGQLTVGQLAALFHISDLLVTNDSGPLHLAAAVGLPTISLFGPETPILYGPLGDNHTVFFKGIDCSPCINVHDSKTVRCRTGKAKCMESISIDDIFNSVSEFFNEDK